MDGYKTQEQLVLWPNCQTFFLFKVTARAEEKTYDRHLLHFWALSLDSGLERMEHRQGWEVGRF